jgi:ubiquinone biosynthesis protein COQ9
VSDETAEPRIERHELLDAALPHVAFDGWTGAALRAGARDLGIDPGAVREIFPKGAAQALAFFSRRTDARMTAAFEAAETDGLRMHERVMLAVELRLHELMPHREAVRRGLSFLALPVNAPLGAKLLYRTVDDIWYAAGDRAADFSFYTKRGLLAGVVASTTLYWLDDGSEDFVATHHFLERRIADVMRLHGARRRVEGAGGRFPNPFRIVRDVVEKRYGSGRI